MSNRFSATRPVACPACRKVSTQTVTVVADSRVQPERVAEARLGTLNRVVCPACGEPFTAPVAVLVHDAGREAAAVYVPAPLRDEAEEQVNALLQALFAAMPDDEPGDWLLTPLVCSDPGTLAAALRATRAPGPPHPADHPHLDEALAWAIARDELVLEVLELIAGVSNEAELIAVLNEFPELLHPDTLNGLSAAAEEAEGEGEPEVGELLRDVLALLHAYTPWDDEDEAAEPEPAPLIEDPLFHLPHGNGGPPELEEARRATENLLEPNLHEGHAEHAILFGSLVEQMLRTDRERPASVPDLPIPPEVPVAPFKALLGSSTHDDAGDVLQLHPELVTQDVADLLEQLAAHALDAEDDALLHHVEMLLSELQIAGLGEDEDDEEEPW
ncbi:MAG: hypothetical protein HYU66_07395 [Armatimonadetes bacterium]|nr:hypothetical protein [Armatimonadota bacterium]